MSLIAKLSPILSSPPFYLAYQTLVGGIRARERCIAEHVRPVSGLTVLDIGCGPGYAITYFPQPKYYGFDVSPKYIRYAQARFSAHGRFFCGVFDESTAGAVPPVDVVLLMGLLHHLDDNEAVKLLTTIKQVMKPEGRLVTLDGGYKNGQSTIAKTFLDNDRGNHIRYASGYVKIADKVFGRVQSYIREDLFRIPYTTVVLLCSP
jgi:SAM-dependent methyltransferase